MFKIVFTEKGEIVRERAGYHSYADAYADINDMDMMIPFTWTYTIEKVEG